MLLNGGGHNVYEFDYLSHGGGYWCGLGFARDFGGHSQRLIARKNFYGGERTEQLFQRFGCGWGCHYALGFCFDNRGNSTYESTIMGSGMAWDCSVGVLCSFGGKDHYIATGGLTQGCGAQAGLGILYHYGDDSVLGRREPRLRLAQHQLSRPAPVRRQLQLPDQLRRQQQLRLRGRAALQHAARRAGGFIIDRPRHDEATTTAARPVTDAAGR